VSPYPNAILSMKRLSLPTSEAIPGRDYHCRKDKGGSF